MTVRLPEYSSGEEMFALRVSIDTATARTFDHFARFFFWLHRREHGLKQHCGLWLQQAERQADIALALHQLYGRMKGRVVIDFWKESAKGTG